MLVRFHGAAGEVTGSCHEVEAAGHRLLLDCGLIQGGREDEARNRAPFGFDPAAIDAVVLSHAHIDHCGRLPLLVRRGFRGPIHCTAATADLLRIMLEDSARLAEADAERENRRRPAHAPPAQPLYDLDDVEATLERLAPHPLDVPRQILPGITLRLREAGHILGSASVELRADEGGRERVLLFSGDVGMCGTPILKDPAPPGRADLVLLESTYGDRLHRPRAETVAELGAVFADAWRDGGNVLIPAFAVGRTQELLYWMAEHYDEWKLSRWQIFLDSPMASKVARVYEHHHALFDADAVRAWRHRNPFTLPNLVTTSDVAQSQAINRFTGGAIIIAGSGMCNGGRIRHHLRQNLGRPNAHVVFAGYQAAGTLGRRLVDGQREVRIFGEEIHVRAQRHTIGGLSAHADQAGLLDWYGAARDADGGHPKAVLVHGEDRAREPMAEAIARRFGARTRLARPGDVVEV